MPRRNTKRNKRGGEFYNKELLEEVKNSTDQYPYYNVKPIDQIPRPTYIKEDPTEYVTLCKKITKKIVKSALNPKGKIVNIPDQDFGDFYCEKIHKKDFNYKFYDRDYDSNAEIDYIKNRELQENQNQKRREQRFASPTSSITIEEINYPGPETYTIEGNITNSPSMKSSSSLLGKKTIDIISSDTNPSIVNFSVPLKKFFEIHERTENIKVRNKLARQSKLIINSGFMETTLIFNFVYKDNKDNMYNVNLLQMYNEYKDPAFNKTYSSSLSFSSMTVQPINQDSSLHIRTSNPDLVLNFEIEFYIDKRDKKDDDRVLIIKNIRLNGQQLPLNRFQSSDGRWHENVVVSNLDSFTNNMNEIKPVLQLAGKLRKRTKRNYKKNKRNHKKSKRSNLK